MNTRNPYATGGPSGGLIRGRTPGRRDAVPMGVKSGSFVIPADTVSALGEGNSESGAQVLASMFMQKAKGNSGMQAIRTPKGMGRMRKAADGGDVEAESVDDESEGVPIQASDGEFLIDPETVAEIGHGSLEAGHRVLEKFVLRVRKENIASLRKLKGPKL